MNIYSPTDRTPEMVQSLLKTWEASVRATHHFLSNDDIEGLKPFVVGAIRAIPQLTVVEGETGYLGFMGVEDEKIEMLFLAPTARGKGLGKKLAELALSGGANGVDVNEDNTQGVGFYLHMGFEVVGRSRLDGQGRPFPLLHLAWNRRLEPDGKNDTIRHAEAWHVPLLNAIEKSASAIFPTGGIPERIREECLAVSELEYGQATGRLWVALDGAGAKGEKQSPVGYALLKLQEDSALLAQVDVLPEHGRKGIGTALVKRVVNVARSMEVPALYLTTFSHVPWNAPFYARLGFRELAGDECPPFVRGLLEEERARGLEHRVAMKYDYGLS